MENQILLVPVVITKYTKMKSKFDDKAGNPDIRKNAIHIINNVIANNHDVTFNELVNQFGLEYTDASMRVITGAYLDGYLDSKQSLFNRLYDEWSEYYKQQ